MADGIAVCLPGYIPFGIISGFGVHVLTVSEESLSRALLLCLERAKQVVEPAGATAVAGLMDNPGMFEPPVVAVLSGGNIDPLLLSKVPAARPGRGGPLPDVPVPDPRPPLARWPPCSAPWRAWARTCSDVMHDGSRRGLRVDEVEVLLQVETLRAGALRRGDQRTSARRGTT